MVMLSLSRLNLRTEIPGRWEESHRPSYTGEVLLRTKTAVFERPVDKLCLLIEEDCSIKGNVDNKLISNCQ